MDYDVLLCYVLYVLCALNSNISSQLEDEDLKTETVKITNQLLVLCFEWIVLISFFYYSKNSRNIFSKLKTNHFVMIILTEIRHLMTNTDPYIGY